jgi:hypothetical protein
MWIFGSVTIRNSAIVDNYHTSIINTNLGGSGIFIAKTPAAQSVTLQYVTISNNTGGNGTGFQVDSGSTTPTIVFTNVIIAHQTAGVCNPSGTLTINGVLWHGNTTNLGGGFAGCDPATLSISNALSGDPLFAADGYHITTGSAAYNHVVNPGELTDDIDHDRRPLWGGYDLGADELVYPVLLPVVVR